MTKKGWLKQSQIEDGVREVESKQGLGGPHSAQESDHGGRSGCCVADPWKRCRGKKKQGEQLGQLKGILYSFPF